MLTYHVNICCRRLNATSGVWLREADSIITVTELYIAYPNISDDAEICSSRILTHESRVVQTELKTQAYLPGISAETHGYPAVRPSRARRRAFCRRPLKRIRVRAIRSSEQTQLSDADAVLVVYVCVVSSHLYTRTT